MEFIILIIVLVWFLIGLYKLFKNGGEKFIDILDYVFDKVEGLEKKNKA